jgi:hypothetical protein
MRFRTTLVLFALTAALVVFIKFYETKHPNTEEANRRAQNVINFERDKIDGIVIQNGEERIELKRADKKWRLESPVKDLADGSTVDSLLFDLEDWKKDATINGKEIEADKNRLNEYGLNKPKLRLKLIEPLRELFKDEVRALGRELGLPPAFVNRHPFPGPGLAIRVPGEVTEEKLAILRRADAIYLDEIRKAGLYDTIWQAFAVLLPVRTVGVMGDARTYDYVCALRAVTSTDGMTADYYDFSHDFLGHAARRIINEVRGINRVVYDITSKPPGTIEWE